MPAWQGFSRYGYCLTGRNSSACDWGLPFKLSDGVPLLHTVPGLRRVRLQPQCCCRVMITARSGLLQRTGDLDDA